MRIVVELASGNIYKAGNRFSIDKSGNLWVLQALDVFSVYSGSKLDLDVSGDVRRFTNAANGYDIKAVFASGKWSAVYEENEDSK